MLPVRHQGDVMHSAYEERPAGRFGFRSEESFLSRRSFTKVLATAGIAASLGTILAGCGSGGTSTDGSTDDSGKKDSLVVYVGDEPEDGFDPCTGWGTSGYMIFQSGLLGFNPDITLKNDLAREHTISDDGRIYTYILRDGVKFSDGSELTAKDVAFTYLTARDSGSDIDLSMLESAIALDSQTVEFKLTHPFSCFASTSAQIGIVPEASYDSISYRENPVGTGPFKLVQWDKGQQVILEPNEYYYGTASSFKRITVLFLDQETALANAQSGQLDVVMVHPEYARQSVAGMELVTCDTVDNRGFSLPVMPSSTDSAGNRTGNDVTSDRAIRHALSIGINREELIANALNGIGTPAFTRVDQLPWYNEQTVFADNRVDEALADLEEAGWVLGSDGIRIKDDVRAEFEVIAPSSDLQRYDLAVAFAQMVEERLGIRVTVSTQTWDQIYENAYRTPILWGFGDYNPYDLKTAYYTGGVWNYTGYSNPTVDGYIDAALNAIDQDSAIENWKKCQWDGTSGPGGDKGDMPYLWLVNIDHCYLVVDGLDLGEQPIHPHGHGWPVIGNLNEWSWNSR